MFKVYHAIKPTFGFGETPQKFPEDFVLVAEVDANDIEDVFYLTNHVERDWRTHGNVKPTAEARRSTSVGDIIVDGEGRVWECANVGWEERKTA